MKIKLNCDMGESFGIYKLGLDDEIMPYIDMANLACGFHASCPLTMEKSVQLATSYNKAIGAHPSYPDLVGFGRRSLSCSQEEIKSIIIYQIGALDGICKVFDTAITYVKPHGALYNDMMKDMVIFETILSTISSYDKNIKLMILSNPNNEQYATLASKYNIELLYEVFADRNYNDDGSLVSRTESYAVILDEDILLQRIQLLKSDGVIYSKNGTKLSLKADTICVHSDSPNALTFVKSIRDILG